jgi:hypothetical protein
VGTTATRGEASKAGQKAFCSLRVESASGSDTLGFCCQFLEV